MLPPTQETKERPKPNPWHIFEDVLILAAIPVLWFSLLRLQAPLYRFATYAAIAVLVVILIRRISRIRNLRRE